MIMRPLVGAAEASHCHTIGHLNIATRNAFATFKRLRSVGQINDKQGIGTVRISITMEADAV